MLVPVMTMTIIRAGVGEREWVSDLSHFAQRLNRWISGAREKPLRIFELLCPTRLAEGGVYGADVSPYHEAFQGEQGQKGGDGLFESQWQRAMNASKGPWMASRGFESRV